MKTENIVRKGITVCILLFLFTFCAGCATTSSPVENSASAEEANRLLNEAVQLNMEQNFEQSINKLTEAIRIYPSFQDAYVTRGGVYYILGKYSEALQDFNHAISFGPRNDVSAYTTAHTMIGRIYNIFSEYENAIESFNRALRISANLAETLNGRAEANYRLGRLPEALTDMHLAISLEPSRYIFFSNRGTIYYELGMPYRALEDFWTSLSLNPYNAPIATNAGKIAKDLGHYELSLSLYDHAIFVSPNFLPARLGRGRLFLVLAELADDINEQNELLEKAMVDFERSQ